MEKMFKKVLTGQYEALKFWKMPRLNLYSSHTVLRDV